MSEELPRTNPNPPPPHDYLASPLNPNNEEPSDLDDVVSQINLLLQYPDNLRLGPVEDLIRFLTSIRDEAKDSAEALDKAESEVERLKEKVNNAAAWSQKKKQEIQDLETRVCPQPHDHHYATVLEGIATGALAQVQELDEELDHAEQQSADNGLLAASRLSELRKADNKIRDWEAAAAALDFESGTPALDRLLQESDPLPAPANAKLDPVYLAARLSAIRRACLSGDLCTMSRILGFLPDAGAPILPQVWGALPAAIRGNHPQPATIADFNDFFSRIELGCRHSEDLADTLGDPATQEWGTSLTHVETLMNQANTTPATAVPTSAKLFSGKDVPRLTNPDDYFPYRTRLEAFFKGTQTPSPVDFSTALYRVLATLDHPTVAAAVIGWDPTPQVRNTWPATWTAFIAALDDKFLPANILVDTMREYRKCHPGKDETAVSFFNRFEAVLTKRRAVERLRGAPIVSDQEAIGRLLAILPRQLVNSVQLDHARRGIITESRTPHEIRSDFEIAWGILTPAATPKATPTAGGRARNATNRPTNSSDELRPRRCGLVCNYDTAPRVPDILRGSLFNNDADSIRCRSEAVRLNVCQYCRRPPSQHTTVGAQHRPVPPANNQARGRAAPALPPTPPGPRIEDVTDRLAIEGAPPSA